MGLFHELFRSFGSVLGPDGPYSKAGQGVRVGTLGAERTDGREVLKEGPVGAYSSTSGRSFFYIVRPIPMVP